MGSGLYMFIYEALRELEVQRPDIQVRNLYLMGSPLAYFIESGNAVYDPDTFAKVQNIVNKTKRGQTLTLT